MGTVFHPYDPPALGKLYLTSGSLTFDTTELTVSGSVSGLKGTNGVVGISTSTNVEVAVFAFYSVYIGSNVSVTVQGTRGLVLTARSAIEIDTEIDVSGTSGNPDGGVRGLGGAGAEGSTNRIDFISNPPPSNRGDGGPASKDDRPRGDGIGMGAATHPGRNDAAGGGYGGVGGNGYSAGGAGKVYGAAALSDLYGGSGGAGGGSSTSSSNCGSGGGGGGSIGLIALRRVILGPAARLISEGGNGGNDSSDGGGGSGGGILLAAKSIEMDVNAVASVQGGAGGDPEGGGGGGGRVAFYSSEDFGPEGEDQEEVPPVGVTVSGGTGYQAGGDGSFYDGAALRMQAPGCVIAVY